MKVGIIGFGRLGKLISKYMIQDSDLYIHDINDHSQEITKLGATPATLENISTCPIIIPLVPISEFEKIIKNLAPLLSDNLIIDVCSVKEMPVNVMLKELPEKVSILGTHPMFGPDSAKETLFGGKIVLCPVRIKDSLYSNIKSYLEANGLKTIESTPEEHDKQIAHSLLLTHFIGRSLIDFEASPLNIDTKGYRRLMKILKTVEHDSWQLFQDMNDYNPYAKETRENFIKSLQNVQGKLK